MQSKNYGRSCLSSCGCFSFLFILIMLIYFLAPISTRFLLLGIDRAPVGTMTGRSDTIMLISADPLLPTVKVLSIPRDLWVTIPGIGENRINTAHFYAEAQEPGSGPELALETVEINFGLNVRYYIRFNLENFPQIVNALSGITLNLPEPMAGLPAGKNYLNGDQALAFLRSRSDGDDFFRMRQGQAFVQGFIRELLKPASWPRIPQVLLALSQAMDTNLPVFLWPRLGLALARASLTGFDIYTIDRSMVAPTATAEGAQVLLPNWNAILSLMRQFE